MRRYSGLMLFLAIAMTCACSSSPGGPPVGPVDGGPPLDGGTGNKLVFVSPPDGLVGLTYGESKALEVRYVDGSDNPIPSGQVTFCNFDVEDGYYMGNVHEQSIAEIWRGAAFEAWRQLVLERRFEAMPLCAKCNDWKYKSWTHNFFKVLDSAEQKRSD